MQTDLEHWDEYELGKQVRNIEYKKNINDNYTSVQRNVVDKIIAGHPEGVTDLEICVLTGFARSSVTARRNEIPTVHAIGIAKYTDESGKDHLNTLWGIV